MGLYSICFLGCSVNFLMSSSPFVINPKLSRLSKYSPILGLEKPNLNPKKGIFRDLPKNRSSRRAKETCFSHTKFNVLGRAVN